MGNILIGSYGVMREGHNTARCVDFFGGSGVGVGLATVT